jgi:segregation and condensation protein A
MDLSENVCIIRLDDFEGPLDLLLHLINRSEMDIQNLQMTRITTQYLDFIRLMEELNINVAAEFLVVAAELLRIKSKMLLPPDKEDLQMSEDEADPRQALAARLMEYKLYKEAAQAMSAREEEWRGVFVRHPLELEELRPSVGTGIADDLSVFDLLEAFQRVLVNAVDDETDNEQKIARDEVTVEQRVNLVLAKLHRSDGRISFRHLFSDRPARREIIVTLLAILELIRKRRIMAAQEKCFGEIEIFLCEEYVNA